MEDKILFSWDIHYTCNYRCPYCWFYGDWHRLSMQNTYRSVPELVKFWANIHKKYGSVDINILGGEPFIYPNFTELIVELSKMHSVQMTTNLSVLPSRFVKEVSFDVRVSPTLHPIFADLDKFIERAVMLKERGIAGIVNYLAYPPQIKSMEYYREKLARHGLTLNVMTFWGKYNGKDYPEAYTEEEKMLIKPCLGSRGGENFQLEPKRVKGRLCKAGHKCASIHADGLAYRCGGKSSRLVGNFFSDDFRLFEDPVPCDLDICPCNEWALLLVDNEKKPEIIKETKKDFIDRSIIPPRRVFITWDIHYACNYNCSYCNTPKPWHKPENWDRDRMKVSYPGIEKLLRIWTDIYKKYGSCEIHITGGEPFIYPNFLDLIAELTKMHTLEIITNLTSDVNDIVNRVTADRVRIGTTFHPEFAKLEEFLAKHIILKKHGFETWANYVAYPPQLAKMGQYKKEFDKLKISFNIQPYMGDFEGRRYPLGYTDAELAHLKDCYDNNDIVNKKTIEWKTGTENKNTAGKLCRMGQMYAKVYPVGDAYRCCANNSQKVGNLFDGSFELSEEPLPCEADLCYCWRCMLVEQENSWAQHWIVPERKPVIQAV